MTDCQPKTVEHVFALKTLSVVSLPRAIGGIAGAKLFHLLEYLTNCGVLEAAQPERLLGGLTIYGLIVGGLAVYAFARKNKMNFLRLADATAPGCCWRTARPNDAKSRRRRLKYPQPVPCRVGCRGRQIGCGRAYPNNVNAVYGPRSAGYTGKLIDPAIHPARV